MTTHLFLGIPYPKHAIFVQQPALKVVFFRGEKFLGIHVNPQHFITNIDEVKCYAENLLAHFIAPQPPLYTEIPFIIFPDISLGN